MDLRRRPLRRSWEHEFSACSERTEQTRRPNGHGTPASSQLRGREDWWSAMRKVWLQRGSFQRRHNPDHQHLVFLRNTLTC